jgi:hypothetical protein
MNGLIKKALLVLAMTMSASPAFSMQSIHACQRQDVVGTAYVYLPFFGEDMKDLRFFCEALGQIHESADVVWNLSDRAYECRVGYFCSQGG